MFVVLLRFASNRSLAGEYMSEHNAWLSRGFDDGVFLVSGNLQPAAGGAILTSNLTREQLEARLAEDPFVEHGIVDADVLQIDAKRVDARLSFLKEPS